MEGEIQDQLVHLGDRNTSYFYRVANIRNASKRMTILKHGHSVLVDHSDIEQHFVQFYSSLYASDNACVENVLIDKVIPSIVSAQDNLMLTSIPSLDEIKTAVFSMSGNSAPVPDGYGCSIKVVGTL